MPRKLTTDSFIRKASIKHNNYYNYNKVIYINNYTKVIITCPIHGDFEQRPSHHLIGQTCFKCSLNKKPAIQKSTLDVFIKNAQAIHGNKYDYSKSKYIGSNKKITINCRLHGEFSQIAASHLLNHGCPNCGILERSKLKTLTNSEFINQSIKVHGNKYNYINSNYISSRTPIEIKCNDHGSFYQLPNNHLLGSGCSKCVKIISNSETRWLDILGIPNDKFHRNVKIKRKNGYFRVDGYKSSTNTIYEFYGDLWHGNPNVYKSDDFCIVTKKTFGEMFSRTIKKELELKAMGYNIISIWESDYKRIYCEKF